MMSWVQYLAHIVGGDKSMLHVLKARCPIYEGEAFLEGFSLRCVIQLVISVDCYTSTILHVCQFLFIYLVYKCTMWSLIPFFHFHPIFHRKGLMGAGCHLENREDFLGLYLYL